MKAKELIRKIEELNPGDDTEIDLLLVDTERRIFYFLHPSVISWNADCSGINSIGIVLTPIHEPGL